MKNLPALFIALLFSEAVSGAPLNRACETKLEALMTRVSFQWNIEDALPYYLPEAVSDQNLQSLGAEIDAYDRECVRTPDISGPCSTFEVIFYYSVWKDKEHHFNSRTSGITPVMPVIDQDQYREIVVTETVVTHAKSLFESKKDYFVNQCLLEPGEKSSWTVKGLQLPLFDSPAGASVDAVSIYEKGFSNFKLVSENVDIDSLLDEHWIPIRQHEIHSGVSLVKKNGLLSAENAASWNCKFVHPVVLACRHQNHENYSVYLGRDRYQSFIDALGEDSDPVIALKEALIGSGTDMIQLISILGERK